MKKVILILGIAALAASCCDKPKPKPTPDPENFYTCENRTRELRWAGVIDYDLHYLQPGGLGIFLLATAPGVDSLETVAATEEMVYVNIPAYQLGQEIDLTQHGMWQFMVLDEARMLEYRFSGEDYTEGSEKVEGMSAGRMYANIEGDSLYISIECTFTNGQNLKVRYAGKVHDLLIELGTGTMTDNSGNEVQVIMGSCSYWDYYRIYQVNLSAGTGGSITQTMDITIPVEFLGQGFSLTQRGSPTGEVGWKFEYRNYITGMTFSDAQTVPYSSAVITGGSIVLTVDEAVHIFHIDVNVNLSAGRGSLSATYTGMF